MKAIILTALLLALTGCLNSTGGFGIHRGPGTDVSQYSQYYSPDSFYGYGGLYHDLYGPYGLLGSQQNRLGLYGGGRAESGLYGYGR